ncbi:Meiotic Sister-Chromatid recombination aldehyde dehydrogenase [Chytriomyces hyalinus]|nr:Meiotic Sister-Chromatid recombination aldehyde dehydrogenase [Chytriomyces hyalinus]
MESIPAQLDVNPNVFIAGVVIAALAVAYSVYKTLLPSKPGGHSKAALVKVPFPEACDPGWDKGRILENPMLRVPYKTIQASFETDLAVRHQDPANPDVITCFDPATGRFLGTRTPTTRKQVYEIVARSKKAQETYQKSSWQLRRDILATFHEYIIREQEGICRVSARSSGKTMLDATFGEIIPTCEKLLFTIQEGEKSLSPEKRSSGTMSFLASARVEYVPVGVMGLIVSWNYPFHNVISPLVSALMAGNGCVIKVSEYSGWATEWLQSLVTKVLEVHGVDPALVTFIDGFAEAGEALVESADKITFIGSPNVGKLVMRHASATLTPVVLELGGKDAAIVFNDCEYENMLKICMRGGLQNCGQNCAGMERMIVEAGIYDRLVKDVSTLLASLRLGTPFEENVDLGAITMKTQIRIMQDLLADAVSKGAVIECGGKVWIHPQYPQGQYFEPTVVTGVTSDMKIHHEEIFGPVFLIYKFKTEEEAVAIINSTEFGLGSAVFSLNYAKAERVAAQVKAGMCNINGWGFSYLCQSCPFGGIKKSGFDRFGGVEGLRGNCHIKAMTTDKLGHLGIRAQVPPILHFPIQKEAVGFQAALIEIMYSFSVWDKVVGVTRLLKAVTGGNGASKKNN